jgi:tRNA G18 (ribose-2'-O)-methylase SpoU
VRGNEAGRAGHPPQLEDLDDPDDPRLADYVNLRGPEFRRVWERQRGLFVAEGEKVVARLLQSPGWSVRSVLIAADRTSRILARLPIVHAPVLVASQAVIDRVTGFNLHRGVLAAADRPVPQPWPCLLPPGGGRLVIAENLNDQENLGALVRTTAALGAQGLLLSPGTCDPLYRRTVRVSMGAVFGLPFATVAPWPKGLVELVGLGWEVVALTPSSDAEDLDEVGGSLRGHPRVAVLTGAEGPGLSAAALAAASRRARIPMQPGIDSLNVVVAAAIALHALRA